MALLKDIIRNAAGQIRLRFKDGSSQAGAVQVDYAWNAGAWTNADNLVDFGHGPDGVFFNNIALGSARTRRVRWLTPTLPTDRIELQALPVVGGAWFPMIGTRIGSTGYTFQSFAFTSAVGGTTSAGVQWQHIDSLTTDVIFGAEFISYNGDASNQSWLTGIGAANSVKWRLARYRYG